MTRDQNLTLVLGATGTTGHRVADRLTARGIPVRRGSRSAEPAFDWNDGSTWAPVLTGVTAAYLVYAPDLVVAGAVDTVERFAAQAVAGGVRRLVLLSGRGEPEAQRAEQRVLATGAEATIVRSAFFAQNFSEKFFADSVRAGTLAMTAGDVGEPFIDADDIADVVVAALTQDGHAGQIYEVTGPRLLSFPEAVAEIAQAADRAVNYLQITPAQFAAALTNEGLPDDLVAALTEVASTVLDGRSAFVTDGVRRVLGREPRRLRRLCPGRRRDRRLGSTTPRLDPCRITAEEGSAPTKPSVAFGAAADDRTRHP